MPDPDLPVLLLSKEQLGKITKDIPMHPDELRTYYKNKLGIPLDKITTLVNVCI